MLTFTSDARQAGGRFEAMVAKQIPFALTGALNDAAFAVRGSCIAPQV
jgi:hypothetical protein